MATPVLDVKRRISERAIGDGFAPRLTVVAGANPNTDIAVSGIELEDVLVGVLQVNFTGSSMADLSGEASITSDGNIQLSTSNTAGSFLIVYWLDVT